MTKTFPANDHLEMAMKTLPVGFEDPRTGAPVIHNSCYFGSVGEVEEQYEAIAYATCDPVKAQKLYSFLTENNMLD